MKSYQLKTQTIYCGDNQKKQNNLADRSVGQSFFNFLIKKIIVIIKISIKIIKNQRKGLNYLLISLKKTDYKYYLLTLNLKI